MTDKDILTAMLDRAGIVYEDVNREGGEDLGPGTSLICERGAGVKNLGYPGFVAILYFNPDGSLEAIGAWE